MFTIEQIKTAHAKVKSGADFPAYIQEIKHLGVLHYTTFVSDGHTVYSSKEGFTAEAPAKYTALSIDPTANIEQFAADLLAHQQGRSDYPTFCLQAAGSGVEKWVVDIEKMSCTYYDKAGKKMIEETIPGK